MPRVIVVGGGWSGCAAAVAVAKLGVEVVLLERTDMLLGTGLVGGLFRNNGRYTGAEEAIAMGAGEMIGVMDRAAIHTGVEFPKHHHGSLYDCRKVEALARQVLADFGVQTVLESRVVGVHRSGDRLTAVRLESGDAVEGKVFVDATGTAGSQANCARYGNGCVMCALRCPTFGKRVSVAAQAGVREMIAERPGGLKGAMSGSAAVAKDTVAREIVADLERTGSLVIPLPAVLQDRGSMQGKVCQQYSGEEFAANLVLIDNGNVKFIHPYFPLERLHRLDGFEAARYVDPYSGGTGNSIRFLGMAPRDDTLKVEGPANLYCGGEKAGIFVGHIEAVVTGALAGHNAARAVLGEQPLRLSRRTAVGEAVAFSREQMGVSGGLAARFTFSGSIFFERMKALGLYSADREAIRRRVEEEGLLRIYDGCAA